MRSVLLALLVAVAARSVSAQAEPEETSPAGDGASPTSPAPVLSVRAPVYDWGERYRGEQLDVAFALENTGTAELKIRSVKPACGCTLVDERTFKKILAPGEATVLRMTIDTGTFRGEIEKTTEIISNGAGKSVSELRVRGRIAELLELHPKAPVIPVVSGGPPPEKPLRLELRPKLEGVELISLAAKRKLLVPTSSQKKDGTIVTHLATGKLDPKKLGLETETMVTNVRAGERQYSLHLPVTLQLLPRIHVTPRRSVYFRRRETTGLGPSANESSSAVRKVLTLTSRGGESHRFSVRGVKRESDLFRVDLAPIEAGKSYRLTVDLLRRPESGKRFVKDVIAVTTDDPLLPELKIPVRAQF